MSCLLCKPEHCTKWYYEDDLFFICDCKSCNIPMVVLKRHDMKITHEERVKLESKSEELFGEDILFRTEQRQIKDHLHWHIIRS